MSTEKTIELVSIGERIRLARKSRRLTQEVLARQMGIGKKSLENYENGITEPTLSVIAKICTYCECDRAWLLGVNIGPSSINSNDDMPTNLKSWPALSDHERSLYERLLDAKDEIARLKAR